MSGTASLDTVRDIFHRDSGADDPRGRVSQGKPDIVKIHEIHGGENIPRPRDGIIDIWCDGSISEQHGAGGCAAILVYGIRVKGWYGTVADHEYCTTNQRMELLAAITGLSALKGARRVRLHSDSSYLVTQMQNRYPYKWMHNGKLHRKANSDLWDRLIQLDQFNEVEWVKVKGHSGVFVNERADKLAKEVRVETAKIVQGKTGEPVMNVVPISHLESPEGWPEECLRSEVQCGHYVGRLYPLLHKKVMTPQGPGILQQAFSDHCSVSIDGEPESGGYGREKKQRRYSPMRFFDPKEIRPIAP